MLETSEVFIGAPGARASRPDVYGRPLWPPMLCRHHYEGRHGGLPLHSIYEARRRFGSAVDALEDLAPKG